MTPNPVSDQKAESLVVISRRADFLAANKGRRQPMPGFVLLVHDRQDGSGTKRIGFTVTKKIGGAVVRNRMKRRFRALARELLPELGQPGADHILIGRAGGIERDFALLKAELVKALKKIGDTKPVRAVEAGRQASQAGLETAEGSFHLLNVEAPSFLEEKDGASTGSGRTGD